MLTQISALENQQLQVLPEEELKIQALLAPLKEELVLLKKELDRVIREIDYTIIDAGKYLQLQALSKEELQLQTRELQLQTLLKKILGSGTDAERTVNNRTLILARAEQLRV